MRIFVKSKKLVYFLLEIETDVKRFFDIYILQWKSALKQQQKYMQKRKRTQWNNEKKSYWNKKKELKEK